MIDIPDKVGTNVQQQSTWDQDRPVCNTGWTAHWKPVLASCIIISQISKTM